MTNEEELHSFVAHPVFKTAAIVRALQSTNAKHSVAMEKPHPREP